MGIYDDLLAEGFISDEGAVSNESGARCDNPCLFTAVATKVALIADDYESAAKLSRLCAAFVARLDHPYDRHPGDPATTSHDELIGRAYCSYSQAKEIRKYGQRHLWCFAWSPRYWYSRWTYLPGYINAACNDGPMTWWQIKNWSAWACATTRAVPADTSSKVLFWLMSTQVGPYCRNAVEQFNQRMRDQYPRGPKEMLSLFYHDRTLPHKHPKGDHPTARYAATKWQGG